MNRRSFLTLMSAAPAALPAALTDEHAARGTWEIEQMTRDAVAAGIRSGWQYVVPGEVIHIKFRKREPKT